MIAVFLSNACAYRIGYGVRSLPGGYDRVAIPIFENMTDEVGLEVYFSNALVREFERSRVARLTSSEEAPLSAEGTVTKLQVIRSGTATGRDIPNLNTDAVYAAEYRLILNAYVRLRRKSDRQIVWEGAFEKEGVYSAPRLGLEGLNSANANYNKSAREMKLAEIAEEMMEEALRPYD